MRIRMFGQPREMVSMDATRGRQRCSVNDDRLDDFCPAGHGLANWPVRGQSDGQSHVDCESGVSDDFE